MRITKQALINCSELPANSYSQIYTSVSGVNDLWTSVKDKATIESSIADREYCMRDFSIRDNNGHELVFGIILKRDNQRHADKSCRLPGIGYTMGHQWITPIVPFLYKFYIQRMQTMHIISKYL